MYNVYTTVGNFDPLVKRFKRILIQHFLVLLLYIVAVPTQQTIPTFPPTIRAERCWPKMLAPVKSVHLTRKFESLCKCCTDVPRARGFPVFSQMVLWLEWLLRVVSGHTVTHAYPLFHPHEKKTSPNAVGVWVAKGKSITSTCLARV